MIAADLSVSHRNVSGETTIDDEPHEQTLYRAAVAAMNVLSQDVVFDKCLFNRIYTVTVSCE